MQKVIRSNVLIPLIEDSYRAEYTEYQRRNLRCSDAGCATEGGEKCERQIYYDIYEGDKKSMLTTGSLMLFDDGRLHEADIRRRLRLVLRSPEKEVSDTATGRRGKLDNTVYLGQIKSALIERFSHDKEMAGYFTFEDLKDPGLELKSVNQFQYQMMADNNEVLPTYYDQVQDYLYLTGLPFFILLIKNRNTMGHEKGKFPMLEFIVFPDPDRQKEINRGYKITKESIDRKILPPRPFLRDSNQCSYCRFKHICWDVVEAAQEQIERKLEGEIPEQKVFETALRTYADLNEKMSEIKKLQEGSKEIIIQYFKATGKDKEFYGNITASYSARMSKKLNKEYLGDHLTALQLIEISDPDQKKLEQLVADRKIDAGILEEAIEQTLTGYTLRVNEKTAKGEARQSVPKLPKKEKKNGKKRKSASRSKRKPAGKSNGEPGKGGNSPQSDQDSLFGSPKEEQRDY